VLFIGALYRVDLSAAQLVTIGVTSMLLTFSAPGIPGGSILIMAPVLLSVGLPVEGSGSCSESTPSPTSSAPPPTSPER